VRFGILAPGRRLKPSRRHGSARQYFSDVSPSCQMSQSQFINTWQDARIYAALTAAAWFCWQRGILGTILSGMAVFLALRFGLGW
jgi:hypothetical protein